MKYEVSKIEAAVDQLDWAIKLFLDEKAYVPAITLAGASEEIIGGTLGDKSVFGHVKKTLESKYNLPSAIISQQHLNRAKNWLKHWTDMKDDETTEIELETEAIQYITRAIANLVQYDQSISSETPRFFEWLNTNKTQLLNGL